MPLLVVGPMMLVVALAWLAWVSGVFATAPASLGRAALKRAIFGALGLLALAPPAAADDQATCRAGGDDGIAACSRLIVASVCSCGRPGQLQRMMKWSTPSRSW